MNGHTVLVVDDERGVRDAWARALRLEGYVVHTAASADRALELCDEHVFDVVIVDFLMPQMDGVELLRRIRKKQPLTRSVLVSGKIDRAADEQEVSREAREAVEADLYLHKPVPNDRLKQAIAELVTSQGQREWKEIAGVVTREGKRGAKGTRDLARKLKKLTKHK